MGKNNTEQLAVAKKYLGKGGATFRKYCGLPSGAAWCAAFVTYIFNEAGNSSLFFGGKKVTYCPTAMKWCDANLAQIPVYLALPSDIIFFDWEPNGVPNHIGFVRERKSDAEVYTIEGNTSGGIVANKTRTAKYVCGCYRPHFKATYKLGKIDVDGYFGYNSIANLQKALGVTVDGILGKGTVKALQKKAGVSQDGSWGTKTSKAVQKMVGTTVDGAFGAKSVKALQTWINKQNGYSSTSANKTATTTNKTASTASTANKTASTSYKVVDVSEWQGKIDWAKVKADGVVGAIIRYADGTHLDPYFDANIKEAKANGLHVGAYIFSRASTKAEAEQEATKLFNACKPYSLDMPLYIDLEDSKLSKYANTVAQAFLNKMKSLGGKGGVYANLNWWNNYLADTAKNYSAYPFWIAQYNDKVTHKTPSLFGMWQYSSTGKVNGINGNVDMDVCYVAYWNTASTPATPTVDTKPVATPSSNYAIDKIVLEVFDGKWGSGDERKKKLTDAGYDYDAIQKRITEVAKHMKSRKEAMKPWFDACKTQRDWSYDAVYNWGKWNKTIAGSKNFGTCITFPNVVAMRCGLIKEKGKIITSTGSDNDSQATCDAFYNNAVKAMNSINGKYWSNIKYPKKTTAQLVKKGKIKEGDIIGFMGHTATYAYKDSKGNLLFNHAGHAAGIYEDKPGSNRAVLDVKSPGMSKRLVYGVFSVNAFIVLTSCVGGTITYSDRYMAGQNAVITIKPDSGKVVQSVKIDGKAVTPTNTYTFSKIDSHHIVEVVCGTSAVAKQSNITLPTLALKKTNAEVIADAIRWAKWIAGDNRFHYGKGSGAHHNGCYFCGTQDKLKKGKGVTDYEFSYCCNPFVGAAWAHGGCDQTALTLCRKCNSWDFAEGRGYDKSPKFTKLGHPAKSALKAGDVLCRETHVALCIGDGKIAHACHEDDNVRKSKSWNSSIAVETLTDKNYKDFPRVYRYNGSVNESNLLIRFGEISNRVKQWQVFLNRYNKKNVVVEDGIFGDATLKYTKAFQTAQKIAVDGIIGTNTLTRANKASIEG